MTIKGILKEEPVRHEHAIALGQYYLDRASNTAEIAFVVQDRYQNHGIGTFLLKQLINIAQLRGLKGFTAEVLTENKAMMAVFYKAGYEVTARLSEGIYLVSVPFDKQHKT